MRESKKVQTIEKCYHCGDLCAGETVAGDGHLFCCQGCKSVYELLRSCQLDGYYQYAEAPGIKQLKAPSIGSFAWLDEPSIISKLLHFESATRCKVTLTLPAIHCASCIWLLEHFHKLVPGILQSRVHFTGRSATFDYDPKVLTLRRLVEQLTTIGYEPDLKLEATAPRKKDAYSRRLATRIGVAGFCFGNIMLLSLPEYLSANGAPEPAYRQFFGYVNFALSLPVLLYSAREYLASARQAVQQRTINMDVPIALGIIALFTRSTYEIFALGGGGYMDSLAALIFFLLIGKWVQLRTFRSLSFERDYRSYFPIAVQVIGAGGEYSLSIDDLSPGQRYRVRSGELIPADSILTEGTGSVDYSFVTGESEPVDAPPGAKVYAGGRQVGASIVLEATKTVDQSYLTGLWNRPEGHKQTHRMEAFADRVGRRFTYVVIFISLAAAAYWLHHDPSVAVNAVSAVLIVACPCALALSFPFAFANAVRLMGRKGLYLKNGHALGRMAEVNHIVFDKTGTLTHGSGGRITYSGEPLDEALQYAVQAMAAQSAHPLSRFVARHLPAPDYTPEIENYCEYPGKGIAARIDGSEIRLGSALFTGVQDTEVSTEASAVYLSVNGFVCGYWKVHKAYRSGLKNLIAALKPRFQLTMLSGDNEADAPAMQALFGRDTTVLFNQTPFDKEQCMEQLRKNGDIVAMVGDGLNDAGALRESDLGISIADDVFQFVPAADAILSTSHFTDLPRHFSFAKATLRVVKVSFALSFLYNATGIFFAVRGALEPVIAAILMPLSSITVVGFVSLATGAMWQLHFKKNR